MRLALRMLARDWRAGELGVLALAIALAVASVTSVGFFADRVGRALERDARELLGADLVLASDHPWRAEVRERLEAGGLAEARSVSFVSMALAGGKSALAAVKAVSERYPLRGTLRIAPAPGAPDAPAAGGPAKGTVWVEERLARELGMRVGSTLQLGEARLRIAAILTLEPQQGTSFFNLAPRLMMSLADLQATGLIRTGSRAQYTLYAAGAPGAVAALERWVKPRLERGQRIEDLASGRPEVRGALDRAQRFLGLTALLAAVLAGVAIALAARRFLERHLDGCAVMRCLGATQRRLLGLHAGELLALGLAASAAGALAGFLAQFGIGAALGELVALPLPAPGPLPALQGFLVGLVLLLGFALPPLVQLGHVPAVRVIRREAGAPRSGVLAAYAGGLAATAALLFWQAGSLRVGAIVVGGFAGAALAFLGVSWLVLRSAARPRALARARRRAAGNAVQAASLAIGLAAVLLLAFVRNDLVAAWRRAAPPDAPNRFVIGIQPDQVAPFRRFLSAHGLGRPDIYPMVRGRVVAVNGKPVQAADYADERAKRLVEREFNLSYMAEPPSYNRIVAGRWFGAGEKALSVERGIAERLGWKLGDELTFDVGGERFSARIGSLREVRWDSMKVNFFVIGPPRLLAPLPTSYITAFRVPPGREASMNQLAAAFPDVTVIDVGAVLAEVERVIDRVIGAVQLVFVFALGAGVLVLYAALRSTEDERRREAALMRVFGASRAQVAAAQRAEFLALGALSGTLAAVAAAAIGELLARRVFDLDLSPGAALWIAGPLAGLALVSLNAWLSARKVLAAPPALTLRDSV